MGISLRQSIAWLPQPATEPTSTIVLTSPQRRFVDVRIECTAADDGSLLPSGPDTPALEWALAGTSAFTLPTPPVPGTSHGVWTHWVDSLYDPADGVVDQGVCVKQADGTFLETGSMVNPATGQFGPYEEVWLDVAILPASSSASASAPAKARCVVLQYDQGQSNRGVVEVLGRYCQGIVRTKEGGVTVERWQWAAPATADDASWRQVFRCGQDSLPCKEAIDRASELQEGETVTCNGLTWTVVEAADV